MKGKKNIKNDHKRTSYGEKVTKIQRMNIINDTT